MAKRASEGSAGEPEAAVSSKGARCAVPGVDGFMWEGKLVAAGKDGLFVLTEDQIAHLVGAGHKVVGA